MNIATLDNVKQYLLDGGFCADDPEAISKVLRKLPKGSDSGTFTAICKLPADFMKKLFGDDFGLILYASLERPQGVYPLDDKPVQALPPVQTHDVVQQTRTTHRSSVEHQVQGAII